MIRTVLTATAAAAIIGACGSALGANLKGTDMHPVDRAADVKAAAMLEINAADRAEDMCSACGTEEAFLDGTLCCDCLEADDAPRDITGAPLGEGDRVTDHRTMTVRGTVLDAADATAILIRWDDRGTFPAASDTLRRILSREEGDRVRTASTYPAATAHLIRRDIATVR